jgi:hypothetical protein
MLPCNDRQSFLLIPQFHPFRKEKLVKPNLPCPVLFLLLAFLSISPSAAQQPKLVAAPDIVPPATAEMQNPDYWIRLIGPGAEKVIMTPEQISALNRKNRTRALETTDINGKPYSFANIMRNREFEGLQFYSQDPLSLRPFPGDSLKIGLKRIRDYVTAGKFWDRRGLPYSDDMKREIIARMSEESVPATVEPRTGILVEHTLNRAAPIATPAHNAQFGWLDMFAIGSFETGAPVAVLHTSADGAWHYIRAEFMYGWVPAVSVAFAPPRNIRRLAESDRFIVVLPHKLSVFGDRERRTILAEVYQGTRLVIASRTADGYRVLVPFRKPDGSLLAAEGWVAPDADVSVGYQPFTQANVIRTMFRLLNRPYGWHDSYHERDCCGAIRTVLKTFGIITPRGTTHELHSSDHVICFTKETPREVKYRQLDTCEPAITMCGFTGHIVMYLGKVDGSYFVIHSNGYSYHDADGTEVKIARVGVCDTEIEGGSNIGEWTELATFKP